MLVYCWQW